MEIFDNKLHLEPLTVTRIEKCTGTTQAVTRYTKWIRSPLTYCKRTNFPLIPTLWILTRSNVTSTKTVPKNLNFMWIQRGTLSMKQHCYWIICIKMEFSAINLDVKNTRLSLYGKCVRITRRHLYKEHTKNSSGFKRRKTATKCKPQNVASTTSSWPLLRRPLTHALSFCAFAKFHEETTAKKRGRERSVWDMG